MKKIYDYFILYSNCLIFSGYSRSLLLYIQRKRYSYVPNDIKKIIDILKIKKIKNVINEFGEENKKVIEEYISFLYENDYGFYTNNPENFIKLSLEWHSHSDVSNLQVSLKWLNKDENNLISLYIKLLKSLE